MTTISAQPVAGPAVAPVRAAVALPTRPKPQAFLSSYAPRLRTYDNSLFMPVLVAAAANPNARTTKRGTTIINYAEDGYDDVDEDEDGAGGRRRLTGLRSLRREDTTIAPQPDISEKVGKETYEPVELQGIYRDWMSRSRYQRSDQVLASQAQLPLTLIPIRLDVDIPAFVPGPAIMAHPPAGGYDLTAFRPGEQTVPYKLRDQFLWNLHESLTTTDQFAATMVQDLDLPNPGNTTVQEISRQIRTQLEEYAGVALHPLFRTEGQRRRDEVRQPSTANGDANHESPPNASAEAHLIHDEPRDGIDPDPDDAYRCIVNLSLNLSSTLYTDKFEWSLLHPPGTAEMFAKQTCADLGLHGEWVPAMTHAIYEAVLRLKKEACETGGMVTGWAGAQEHPNDAAQGTEAGWRYDPEHLGDAWEPKVEILSKEEIEKREVDRERQIRRLRRETARFTTTTGLVSGNVLQLDASFPSAVDEDRLGRGERGKKKRRFRSLSPLGRSSTPVGGGTTGKTIPDVAFLIAGYGGGGALTDQERTVWRCTHCRVRGTAVWAVREGPLGPKGQAAPRPLAPEEDHRDTVAQVALRQQQRLTMSKNNSMGVVQRIIGGLDDGVDWAYKQAMLAHAREIASAKAVKSSATTTTTMKKSTVLTTMTLADESQRLKPETTDVNDDIVYHLPRNNSNKRVKTHDYPVIPLVSNIVPHHRHHVAGSKPPAAPSFASPAASTTRLARPCTRARTRKPNRVNRSDTAPQLRSFRNPDVHWTWCRCVDCRGG